MTDYTKEQLSNQVRYLRFLLAQAYGSLPPGVRGQAETFLANVPGPPSGFSLDDVHKLNQAHGLGPHAFLQEAARTGLITKNKKISRSPLR